MSSKQKDNDIKFDSANRVGRRKFLAVSSGAFVGGVAGAAVLGGLAGYFGALSSARETIRTVTTTETHISTVTSTQTITEQPAPPRVIKIGGTVSETGVFAAAMGVQGKMYKAAESVINEMGGIYVDEYKARLPIQIIYYDDKSDPATVERFYTRLIYDDKVDFLLGAFTAINSIPASTIAERAGIPYIDNAAAERPIFGKKWVIGSLDLVEKWLTRYFEMVDWYMNNQGYRVKTFAFANSDEPFGNETADFGIKLAEKYGFEIVGHEKFLLETTDFTSIIAKFKSQDPDILLITEPIGPPGAVMLKQAVELGLRPRGIHMTQGMLRAARDILGPNISEGITGEDWTPPELPTHGMIPKWVYEKIQERAQFSHEDYPWVTVAYLSLEILLSGITVAGTLDKERVLDVLRNIEIITYSGRWHVDKHEDKTLYGHSNLLPYPIQMQGGKRVILWPPEYATGRWLYPLRWG